MELVELKHKLERVPQSSTMQRGWPDAGKVETTDEHGHEKERSCFLTKGHVGQLWSLLLVGRRQECRVSDAGDVAAQVGHTA